MSGNTNIKGSTNFNQLPNGYLSNGYLNKNGEPDVRYVTDIAEEIAQKLAPMKKHIFGQMYDKIQHVAAPLAPLNGKQLEINRLVPLAAHLVNKGKAPKILLDFCKANANAVKSAADCTYFCYHMEAVYGYMR